MVFNSFRPIRRFRISSLPAFVSKDQDRTFPPDGDRERPVVLPHLEEDLVIALLFEGVLLFVVFQEPLPPGLVLHVVTGGDQGFRTRPEDGRQFRLVAGFHGVDQRLHRLLGRCEGFRLRLRRRRRRIRGGKGGRRRKDQREDQREKQGFYRNGISGISSFLPPDIVAVRDTASGSRHPTCGRRRSTSAAPPPPPAAAASTAASAPACIPAVARGPVLAAAARAAEGVVAPAPACAIGPSGSRLCAPVKAPRLRGRTSPVPVPPRLVAGRGLPPAPLAVLLRRRAVLVGDALPVAGVMLPFSRTGLAAPRRLLLRVFPPVDVPVDVRVLVIVDVHVAPVIVATPPRVSPRNADGDRTHGISGRVDGDTAGTRGTPTRRTPPWGCTPVRR